MTLPPGVTEQDVHQLNKLVAQSFQNAQKSVASHRKLVASLKNVQDRSAAAGLEDVFNSTFARMVNRVLVVKKSEASADRIVKLIESFVGYIQITTDEQENMVATRFVEFLIRHLLRGIGSKLKTVRFRTCQLIAVTINHLGEIGDELFDLIKHNLCKRLYDKEMNVRLQTALALSRLQGVDDDEGDLSVSQLLISVLQNDPSADVRRAILFNLEKNSDNLPYLLERAWDTHPTNRRSVYSRTMKEIGDFRLLTIKMREKILQWGLRDRDESVKAAATKMFVSQWLETTNNDLLEVLERLDVLNSQIAETAMLVFFENRKDTLDKIEFSDDFWHTLTAESVFLARTFNEFCVKNKLYELTETRMPELTKLAALIDHYLRQLQEESDAETTFIVEQLLMIAETYDFGDEVGRRNTLALLRDVLVKQILTSDLIRRSVEVIRKLSVSESDFSQVLVEVVSDIRDTLEEDGNPEKELVALLSCLAIAQSVLELIEKPLENNVHLASLLDGLVIPSVRSHDTPVRERGLRCLGLSCLLSKELAQENLQLFMMCFTKGHESLKMEAIRIITDILMLHGTGILDVEDGLDTMSVYKMYYRAARNSEEMEVQALAAEALCKLVLAGIFTDDDLIKALILVFFDGGNSQNAALKQILSFCMPVYCYSSVDNQKRVGRVVVDTLRRLCNMYETDSDMVTPTVMLQQLIDWTDPQKTVLNSPDARESSVHVDLSVDILRRIRQCDSKDERKALCSGLNKLHFPQSADLHTIREIRDEANILKDGDIDTVSRNALGRFSTALDRAVAKLEASGSASVAPSSAASTPVKKPTSDTTDTTVAATATVDDDEDEDDDATE